MMEYSPVIPIPPSICRASRAICAAISQPFRLAIDTCAGVALFSFINVPNRQFNSCAFVISVIISASFFCCS